MSTNLPEDILQESIVPETAADHAVSANSRLRTIEQSRYFSPESRAIAVQLDEFQDQNLVTGLEEGLGDPDTASMANILREFRECQNSIVALSEEPTEDTYHDFQIGIDRFLALARQYAGSLAIGQDENIVAAADSSHSGELPPRADKSIERDALGLRLKFLAKELKEMTRTVPYFAFSVPSGDERSDLVQDMLKDDHHSESGRINPTIIRPSLAHRSAPQLFGRERQQDVLKYLVQVEELLGSKGLQFTGKGFEKARSALRYIDTPRRAVMNAVGNIRNRVYRALVVSGAVISGITGAYQTYSAVKGVPQASPQKALADLNDAQRERVKTQDDQPVGPGSIDRDDVSSRVDTASSNSASPDANADEGKGALEKVNAVFGGMKAEVENGQLKITFKDLSGFTVNDDLWICLGAGSKGVPQEFRIEGGSYFYKLSDAEAKKGKELGITLQVRVEQNAATGDRWLTPRNTSNGKTEHKLVKVQ